MRQPKTRRSGLIALGAAVVALTTVTPASAGAPRPPAAGSSSLPGTFAAAGAPRTVTLITGDKVTVTTTADATSVTSVRGPHGEAVGAHVMTQGKNTWVYPESATPYVASGVLDNDLFNITELLADRYDDAHSDHLPLLVSYTDAAFRSRSTAVPKGARRTLTLDSIQGAALAEDRSAAAGFWASLTGTSAAPGARSQAEQAEQGGAATLTGGIAKVWLDGKAKAMLSDSTAQIGAPAAWQSGDTGQGVDVAVLDTGIDAAHPDFGGRIAATSSFVPGEDVTDRHGHGTHVASTIAGTGAASGGKEKGVAPGASLHIGKVLDDTGSGQDSWILAGMEWAVQDQHAKIVNMSLGDAPTDGTDPLSQAVDNLSAETGALFVIAAGNSGPEASTVGAPGSADAALTVGAVDSSDQLASFSSRGPRMGDNALKPEITAPGVDIVAARSQYAQDGEGPYLTLSGTSQATPHVAGTAALLAQLHPDWSGQQLKDALISTSKATPRYPPFAGGSGRLDAAAAVKDTVFATGSSFVPVRWPYSGPAVVRKDVTYTNTGSAPVTLGLSVNAPGVPAALFTLTASTVTVPAHGTSTVGVLTDLGAATADVAYSAVLDATGPDGVLRTHSLLGTSKEGEKDTVSVAAEDPKGLPLAGELVVKDIAHDSDPKVYEIDPSGSADLRLPPSTYSLWMYADIPGLDGAHSLSRAVISSPEVVVSGDRKVVLSASGLRKIQAVTPKRSTTGSVTVEQIRAYGGLFPFADAYQLEPWLYDDVWATPTPEVTQGTYTFATRWRQVQPPLTVSSGSHRYDSVLLQSMSPKPKAKGDYRTFDGGNGSAADFAKLKGELKGDVAVVRRNDAVPPTDQADRAAAAGAALLLIVNDGYGPLDAWADLPEGPALPVASISTDEGRELLASFDHGKTTLKLTGHPYPAYLYDLVSTHEKSIPEDLTYRPAAGDLARIDESLRDTRQGEATDGRLQVDQAGNSMSSAATTVQAQGDYTAWVTADPHVMWSDGKFSSGLTEVGSSRAYKPRSTTKATWFGPAWHPRLLSDAFVVPAPFRGGDTLVVLGMSAWGDSGGHMGNLDVGMGTVQTSLYQGSTLIGQGTDTVFADTAPGALPYRLVVDSATDTPDRPYAPTSHTEWGFTSTTPSTPDIETLPLLQLDYAVSTDLSGRAARRTDLTVTPASLAGVGNSTVRTVTVDVSYDDGATWQRAVAEHKGDGWKVHLKAPSKASFTSLRVTAADNRGSSISQTVVRAFGLR